MKARQRFRDLAGSNPVPGQGNRQWLPPAWCWAVLGGVAGWMWWEHPLAALAVAALSVAAHSAVRRGEPVRVRREKARQAAELPFALDVAAAVLRAGAPVDVAVESAAEVTTARNRECLAHAARALRLGVASQEACQWLNGIPAHQRIATAITRSIHSGAMLAGGLELLAGQLREERELEAQATAHRNAVWMVLPLCLCFLPAFVIAGLIPVLLSAVDLMLFPA